MWNFTIANFSYALINLTIINNPNENTDNAVTIK
jgi:hypothetical protein